MENSPLKEYLDYYIKLKSPGYAVLITGEWGAGKTFQVENSIPKEIQCHISLFGMNSTSEIYASVYAKMFPGKNIVKKAAGMAKDSSAEFQGITFGAGAIVGSVLDAMIKEKVDESKVIIFDDLERCKLSNEEILGAINKYVEHHKSRVIVLAHDEKTEIDFNVTKEKIIGHTIKVKPQIDEAAKLFFSESKNLDKFIIAKNEIINTFKKTKCQSLRIFKHVIKDCERLRKCLEIRHLKNFEAMRVLFSNFTIMNVEFRCGNITIEDVKEIPEIYNLFEFNRHRIVAGEMVLDEAQKRLLPIFFKYNEQELIKNILDFNTIADILESGDYQAKIITSELNSHKYFMDPVESPAWLNVISFDHLEDDVVKEAIKKLHHQFTNRQIEDIGEMIHMFHGLFLLTQNRELEYSYEELLIEIKKYIDDLLHSNRLPASPLSPHPFDDDIYERSYNHGYWVSNEYRDYVDDAISYLKDKPY